MYSGFYVTQLILAFYTMGGFKLKTLMLANASFPIYIKAFFNALTKRDQAWQATNAMTSYDSPFNYVRMQVYIFIFLFLTSIVGAVKSIYTAEFSISLAWNVINTVVFSYFVVVAHAEARALKRQRKRDRKEQKIIVKGVTS
jgi:cellulose synthase (UDP-forming)